MPSQTIGDKALMFPKPKTTHTNIVPINAVYCVVVIPSFRVFASVVPVVGFNGFLIFPPQSQRRNSRKPGAPEAHIQTALTDILHQDVHIYSWDTPNTSTPFSKRNMDKFVEAMRAIIGVLVIDIMQALPVFSIVEGTCSLLPTLRNSKIRFRSCQTPVSDDNNTLDAEFPFMLVPVNPEHCRSKIYRPLMHRQKSESYTSKYPAALSLLQFFFRFFFTCAINMEYDSL